MLQLDELERQEKIKDGTDDLWEITQEILNAWIPRTIVTKTITGYKVIRLRNIDEKDSSKSVDEFLSVSSPPMNI